MTPRIKVKPKKRVVKAWIVLGDRGGVYCVSVRRIKPNFEAHRVHRCTITYTPIIPKKKAK